MCTAISFQTKDHYFGRNLDLEYHYQEQVTVTPRNYPFEFRMADPLVSHHAMIGMATVDNGYPLYYEATNERGLSMAGLNFPGNAVYREPAEGKTNITPFELIPWLLGKYETVAQVRTALADMEIVNIPYSEKYPLSPLHWIISDKKESITLESVAQGIQIYDNPVGVLANNPPFPYHMYRLTDFMGLSRDVAQNRFSKQLNLKPHSLGLGSYGLPGDLSSPSRFVRAAYIKLNSVCGDGEAQSVSQFFHILSGVAQRKGMAIAHGDQCEYTVYSSCCNTEKGIYYYTTYENSQITAVDMHKCNLQGSEVTAYPLVLEQQIHYDN